MKKAFVVCLILLLLGCLSLAEEEAAPVLVAENDRLFLYVTKDLSGIEVVDKQSGSVWSSSMNDETFDMAKTNAMWKKKMSSMLMINYTNLNQGLGSINNMAFLVDKQPSASYEAIDRGVRLHYVFGSCEIELDVEVTIDSDSLLVRIPYERINEYGIYSVVSIDLMPFFCAASDQAEGYFLYPDGCGAIMEFTDIAHMNEKTKLYTVYGDLESHESLLEFLDAREPTVMLPVFGMNRGNQGVVCIVEEGAETARISLNSSNKIVKANYLFANFLYRRGFDDKRVTDRSFKIYDKKAIETDYALRVLFLNDGDADYSAMARAYRAYLMKNGTLSKSAAKPSVALDIFLSTEETGLIIDVPRTVTTLEQAEEILKSFHEDGVQDLTVSLKGWSQGGYLSVPDHFPVDSSVGGEDALISLMRTADEMGYSVSLNANFLDAREDQSGYSRRNDVVYTGNYAILTNLKETMFLLSPDVMLEKFENFMRNAETLPLSGVRFEGMGDTLLFNYASRRYITSAETLAMYERMQSEARDAFGYVSVTGGSLYAAKGADLLTNIPMDDYNYQFTTKNVPFYQMVMHGLVAYTGTPGNLSSDLDREVLRWVEMGYTPYFELTYTGTEDLMYTDYQSLFSAEFSAWRDEVAKIAEQFETGDLKDLHNALIMRHEEIQHDLFRVTYDNGYTVYVNYGNADVEDNGIVIPAMEYAVIKEARP